MADAALANSFELNDLPAGFVDDPFPVYHALLEHAPVKHFTDGSIMLSRFDDLDRVYRDTTAFSSDKKVEFWPKYGDTPLYEHHTTSLVFSDPPLHTRVRKIMVGALNPRALAAMEPGLIALVERLIAALDEKDEADLIEDFASAIPVEVIGNLFDIPRAERGPLRDWSLAILGALEPVLTKEQEERGNNAVTDFKAYLKDLADERRRKPGDPATDVLTRLIDGVGGEKLTETELLQNCIFILNAGHETTTNLIGNALASLDAWPDERRKLIADPSLVTTAVDEFLRFESPNQLGNRMSTGPVEFHGEEIPAGTRIHLCIGAANRDPRQFPDPDRLDITRKPNKHHAFAGGPHLCVGFSLARMEGRIAVTRFLERFPGYQLTGNAVRNGRVRFRGYASLPARLR
ncbi:MAG: cytochrome P450 [Rhizobiaceae bacterium]